MKRQTFDGSAALAGLADAGPVPADRAEGLPHDAAPHPGKVRQLAEALRAMARELDRDEVPAPVGPARGSRVAIVAGALHRDRLHRARYFPAGLFGEPAWDILLDLFAALHGGELRSVKEVCLAANVPEATALRHIEGLIAQGLVTRRRDRTDNRRKFLTISPDGSRRMLDYLRSIYPHLDRWDGKGL